MAIGVIIGGAFGKIVASFVSDVLMPRSALLMGKSISRVSSSIYQNATTVSVAAKAAGARRLTTGCFCKAYSTSSSLRS